MLPTVALCVGLEASEWSVVLYTVAFSAAAMPANAYPAVTDRDDRQLESFMCSEECGGDLICLSSALSSESEGFEGGLLTDHDPRDGQYNVFVFRKINKERGEKQGRRG